MNADERSLLTRAECDDDGDARTGGPSTGRSPAAAAPTRAAQSRPSRCFVSPLPLSTFPPSLPC